MKRLLAALCLVFLISPAAHATPTLDSFGVSGTTAVFNCPWNAEHTGCGWSEFTYYNGVTNHTPTGVTSSASDARGEARVSATISSSSYLPSLHAYAYSNPEATGSPGAPHGGSSIADANVWGVQGYTYTGDSPFLLTLTATLDTLFSRPNADLQGNHSYFRVSLFDTAAYAFEYSVMDPDSDSAELCPILRDAPQGNYCQGMPTVFASDSRTMTDTGTSSVMLSYWLAPGQSFYVGAFLDGSVCCGETVDSSHSLNMVFNDVTQFSSFAVPGVMRPVPEPASLPMALLGLGLLFGLRRNGRAW